MSETKKEKQRCIWCSTDGVVVTTTTEVYCTKCGKVYEDDLYP